VNYAFARDQYRKSKNAALSSLSDPHEMIGLTLRELSRSLNALQNDNLTEEQRNLHLSKGFTAVYILQTSLDFEKGFEIASNLFKIYEFVREQLQKTLKRDATTNLAVCSGILDEIIDAWSNIK
jgi:flagellar secretion chaperone FliS